MQEMQSMLYFKKERIMRKKTLALFLTCVLAAGMLAGCGNKDSKDNNQVENSQVQSLQKTIRQLQMR